MTSTERTYFDQMYDGDPDPWGFETSAYEQRKYALTMASLPRPHYGSVFEPGCSIGVLTEMLATRCDRLLATDLVPAALTRARDRCAALRHVTVERRAIPEEWPEGRFDLVVLSEIAYYFDPSDLARVMALVMNSTKQDAQVLGVHWRGETDYPLRGDEVHEILRATPELTQVVHHVEDDFVLDVWERRA
jgi:cyclopropane fatty-acyl-phospholipid synthase-like methyltransferase